MSRLCRKKNYRAVIIERGKAGTDCYKEEHGINAGDHRVRYCYRHLLYSEMRRHLFSVGNAHEFIDKVHGTAGIQLLKEEVEPLSQLFHYII